MRSSILLSRSISVWPIERGIENNGNITTDANKGITGINYNHLNLPTEVKFDNNNQKKITYIYDASGIKLRKVVNDPGKSSVTTEYAGNFVYTGGNLQFFNHPEGYVEPDGSGGYTYVYNYKDQVQNVRLTYADLDGNGLSKTSLLHLGLFFWLIYVLTVSWKLTVAMEIEETFSLSQ